MMTEVTVDESETPEKIILEIPAKVKYLEVVSVVLETVLSRLMITVDESTVFGIKLAVHEACTNIIEHAYGGQGGQIRIRVTIEHQPVRRLMIELEDDGQPADEANFVEPDLENPQVSGYGLFLMQNFVDEVRYIRKGGVNQWLLVKVL